MAPRPHRFASHLLVEEDSLPVTAPPALLTPSSSVVTIAQGGVVDEKKNHHLLSEPQKVVILVDPLSTGVELQRRILTMEGGGIYQVVIVFSDRSQPAAREKHFERSGFDRDSFLAVILHEAGGLEQTIDAVLAATFGMDICAIMCGAEFGVLLEDELAQGLNQRLGTTHLKSSGIAQLSAKVDKHLQANTIRKAGLDAVRETLAKNEEDVEAFLQAHPDTKTFVVKPQTGAGSVGVTMCHSQDQVREAFAKIMAGEHKAHCGDKYRHYEQAGVLLQEYLDGDEYIVNSVVRDGVIKTTAMWKYDKVSLNLLFAVCCSVLTFCTYETIKPGICS